MSLFTRKMKLFHVYVVLNWRDFANARKVNKRFKFYCQDCTVFRIPVERFSFRTFHRAFLNNHVNNKQKR